MYVYEVMRWSSGISDEVCTTQLEGVGQMDLCRAKEQDWRMRKLVMVSRWLCMGRRREQRCQGRLSFSRVFVRQKPVCTACSRFRGPA